MRRVLSILLVAAGLSPGLYWREAQSGPEPAIAVGFERIAPYVSRSEALGRADTPRLVGSWALTSPIRDFGSYSALLALEDGVLLALSDRGRFLRFDPRRREGRDVAIGPVFSEPEDAKHMRDIEAATRDAASGRIWAALEGRNALIRMDEDFSQLEWIEPREMRDWSVNGGPEAMVRLGDGRFIVLAESGGGALLYPGDPFEAGPPARFHFRAPSGFAPTDMAELPDGKVLVLLRGIRLGLPPGFVARLVIADPATIEADRDWQLEEVSTLATVPMDNYEGLAIVAGMNGATLTLWLISDNNSAHLIQRTLLTRLEWDYPPRR
ncbi:MAG TPA: esterase-like activity of phytase family protein [Sphingomonadaceae bacterium]|nr:esterase-like activity of phytase family protein [Sphingomonadaceae bacterium]